MSIYSFISSLMPKAKKTSVEKTIAPEVETVDTRVEEPEDLTIIVDMEPYTITMPYVIDGKETQVKGYFTNAPINDRSKYVNYEGQLGYFTRHE